MSTIKNLYASHCYADFNRRIDATLPWVTSTLRSFCGYGAEQVASRFRQRCAELALPAFVRARAADAEPAQDLVTAGCMDCNGVRFEADGRIRLAPALFMCAVAEFVLHWLHALGAILCSLRPHSGTTESTLVFGVGMENLLADGSDARFLDCCRRGPVKPLVDATTLVVQATQRIVSTTPARARYRRFPLFASLYWHGLGLSAWLRALADHVLAFASFIRAVRRCAGTIILGRDAAYHAVAAALNRVGGLQAVVFTNSNYSAQPLWAWALADRRYHAHMVWYSQNSVPVVYTDDPVDVPLPNFRFMTVDETWVWTDGFRAFLEKLGCRGVYHVVGPILWYLPGAPSARDQDEIRIAVFDVTPVRDEVASTLGLVGNYYSTANMIRFIEDIVHVRAKVEQAIGRRVRILLKHKRGYKPVHDPRYISLIEKLSGPEAAIELVSPDANMYAFSLSCDLTLVIPYSSPAHVAVSLDRPAIYYDPTMLVQPVYEQHRLLTFVAGREQLVKVLPQFLNVDKHQTRLRR